MLLVEPPTESGTDDYKVGPGKPPRNRQFGQPEGNPRNNGGMPKGYQSARKLLRKAACDPSWTPDTPLGEIVQNAIQEAKVGKASDALSVMDFHDGDRKEAPESATPAKQHYTPEQRRMAMIAMLRAEGFEKQAKELEEQSDA